MTLYCGWGRRVIVISGSLIWSKTLMELIFNPCGEFRWSPDGSVSQIHSPHLLVGAPGIFSDLLRFVHMLKREWGAESNGKLPYYSSLVKLQPRFLSLEWKTCLWAELQPWCLSLQWRTCPWVEHMMMMMNSLSELGKAHKTMLCYYCCESRETHMTKVRDPYSTYCMCVYVWHFVLANT